MPRRPSDREAFLELEAKVLRAEITGLRADPGDIPIVPCSHDCICATWRGGMSTNGGCMCDDKALRRAVQWWRRRARFLQVTIQDLRGGCAPSKETSELNSETD